VTRDTPSSDDAWVYEFLWNCQGKRHIWYWPIFVTLTLEVGIYRWYVTHCLVMTHVSMKFHEILLIRLEVVIQTIIKGIFDLWSLLVTLTLEVGTYKWHSTHCQIIMHVSMKFHEIIFKRLEVMVRTRTRDIWSLTSISDLDLGIRNL